MANVLQTQTSVDLNTPYAKIKIPVYGKLMKMTLGKCYEKGSECVFRVKFQIREHCEGKGQATKFT